MPTGPRPPRYTPEELDIIAMLRRAKGREPTEQEINLARAQARAIGELPQDGPINRAVMQPLRPSRK